MFFVSTNEIFSFEKAESKIDGQYLKHKVGLIFSKLSLSPFSPLPVPVVVSVTGLKPLTLGL